MEMTGDHPRSRLALIGFACGALALGASSAIRAQDAKPADKPTDAWAQIVAREAPETEAAADPAVTATADPSATQAEPDWSELGKPPDAPSKTLRTAGPRAKRPDGSAWSRNDNGNGTSVVAVKVSPFLDTRVGANLNLVKAPAATLADSLSDKMLSGDAPKSSSGTAWASMTGPGVPHVWDKTAVDVSMDSGTDQGRVGTTLSRSVPLADNAYSVTLQNAYRLTQPAPTPLASSSSQESRTLEIERSAKFSANQTGTSLVAGQTLSSADDKWLGKVGAEQKFFGDVTVTGSVNETVHGPVNKSLTAGFKKSW
jgi:hypothetical protein